MPNETLIQIGEPILFLTHPSSRSSWNITLLSSSTLLLCCASMVRCAACGVRRGARLMCGSCITSTKTKGWRTCRDVRRTCRTRCLDSRASQAAPRRTQAHTTDCAISLRAHRVRQLYIHSNAVLYHLVSNFRNVSRLFCERIICQF